MSIKVLFWWNPRLYILLFFGNNSTILVVVVELQKATLVFGLRPMSLI